MFRVPSDFNFLLAELKETFHRRQTARMFILFFAAAIVVVGKRTVSAVLRLLSLIMTLNPSTYHRLFSHRKWSSSRLAFVIIRFVLNRFCPDGSVRVVGG